MGHNFDNREYFEEPLREKLEEWGIIFSKERDKGAAFLFPDGLFLNISQNDEKLPIAAVKVCHRRVDVLIEQHRILLKRYYDAPRYCAAQTRALRITDNAIILNDGFLNIFDGCFVDLPPKELTPEQINSLTNWLDDVAYKSKKILYVNLYRKLEQFEPNSYIAEDVIKAIKRLYRDQINKEEK